eukprot:3151237-Pyramimonas_sp.AAC.1
MKYARGTKPYGYISAYVKEDAYFLSAFIKVTKSFPASDIEILCAALVVVYGFCAFSLGFFGAGLRFRDHQVH